MGDVKLEDIIEAVSDLNDQIWGDIVGTFAEGEIELHVKLNGMATCVEFLGAVIYCSENDERLEIEDTDTYESIKEFLLRTVQDRIKIIAGLKTLV